jgi:hypothetical protein
MSLSSVALGVVLIASLPQPGFEESLDYHKFPNIDRTQSVPNCYAQTHNTRNFDLTRLCGFIPTSSSSSGGYTGGGGYSSGNSSGGSGGVCNVPSDTASDGSHCGGRAASEKKGGR